MDREFNEKIQLIKDKVNIADVIGQYLKLTRKGHNYWAVCPFHQDSNPSLSVSPEKQIYKCFSCGETGNVFIFLQKFKKIDFISSLQEVAKIAKIDLKELKVVVKEKKQEVHPFKELNNISAIFFQYQLTTNIAQEALNYLKKRNISEQVINDFQIGFAPKDNELLHYLVMQGYDKTAIIESGLAKVNDKDEILDMFMNRITFPIFDLDGSCLGFSARRYFSVANDNFKYINTPETEIFKKSKILYNLYHASKTIKNANDAIYLVEGYMDVIALYQKNIKNCVAIMGTSLTKEQMNILRKITNNIIIFLDGDVPGKLAAYKIAINLINSGFSVKIIDNQLNLDPDELINTKGELFNEVITNQLHPLQFAIDFFRTKYNLTQDSFQVKEFLIALQPLWQVINDPITLKFYLNSLQEITNLKEEEIFSVLKVNSVKQSINSKLKKKSRRISNKDKLITLQKELMFLLLLSREVFVFLEKEKFIFYNNNLMNLYFLITQKYYENDNIKAINLTEILEELKDNEIFVFLQEVIALHNDKKYEININTLKDYLIRNKIYLIETEVAIIKQEIAQTNDKNLQMELLKKMSDLKKTN